MKYLIYPLLAVALLFSCKKEMITNEDQENIQTPEITASTSGLPTTITATLSDNAVKTIYDSDGVFSWYKGETSEDRIQLLVVQDLTTFTKQGVYTYKVKSLSADKKTAVFTSTSTAGDLMDYTDGAWKSTGIAIYPTGMNRDGDNEYGLPYIKLPQLVSGETKDIVLTGVPMGDNSNFKFSTAMGLIKLTINNIPSKATELRIYTNRDSYPIDGDFMLEKDANGIVTINSSDYKKYNNGTSHSAHDHIKVSLSGESSRTFFINLPVANYPKGTLSVLLCDNDGGQIMKRAINVALNIERNVCLEIPELSCNQEVSVGGSLTNPRVVWSIEGKMLRFDISQSEDNDLSKYYSGNCFTNSGTKYTSSGAGYPEGYAMSALSQRKPSTSGKYYLHYVICSNTSTPTNLTDANVIQYGTIPFCYLKTDDQTLLIGTYTTTGTVNNIGTSSANLIIAASTNTTKGNLMITTFFGREYTDGNYGVGTPVFGVYDGTNITFTDDHASYFFFHNNNKFNICKSTDSLSKEAAFTNHSDAVFSVNTTGPILTCADNLVFYFNEYKAFVWGENLSFTK